MVEHLKDSSTRACSSEAADVSDASKLGRNSIGFPLDDTIMISISNSARCRPTPPLKRGTEKGRKRAMQCKVI